MRVLIKKESGGMFSRLIRWKTHSRFVHAELLFDNGDRYSIGFNHRATFYRPVFEQFTPGFEWDAAEWDCFEIGGPGYERITRLWCEEHEGAEYDWLGIAFCQVFPWGREDEHKWFCSEMVVAALQAGLYQCVVGMKPYQYSPAKLHRALSSSSMAWLYPNDDIVLS